LTFHFLNWGGLLYCDPVGVGPVDTAGAPVQKRWLALLCAVRVLRCYLVAVVWMALAALVASQLVLLLGWCCSAVITVLAVDVTGCAPVAIAVTAAVLHAARVWI